jgi:hypothetical protein
MTQHQSYYNTERNRAARLARERKRNEAKAIKEWELRKNIFLNWKKESNSLPPSNKNATGVKENG